MNWLSEWWAHRSKLAAVKAAQKAREVCVCGHLRWEHSETDYRSWCNKCHCSGFVKDASFLR